jgi:hypothetical protein
VMVATIEMSCGICLLANGDRLGNHLQPLS